MKRIDFETHFYVQEFLDAIADRTEVPIFETSTQTMYHGGDGVVGIKPILPKLLDLTEERIRDMDEAGIDIAVLSHSLGVEQLEEEAGCREAVRVNNALAAAIALRPDRLKGYVLHLPRYIMYCVVLFGYVCVMLGWLSVLLVNRGRKFE